MIEASDLIAAVIIIASNVFGGNHGSINYERVTAIFGWAIVPAVVLYAITGHPLASKVAGFTIIAAFSRDYEKVLRTIFRK